ncbi:hypothetical protein ACFXPY_31975 [Streptomyces sp. NPDC059153]|uniref:hypothetical protein n=1 Tax=unclassified Streptomyces TaxID=2593676 RepID=UPI0036813AB7
MRARGRITLVAALASVACLVPLAQSATAGPVASAPPAEKTLPWQASQGDATAAGTRTLKSIPWFQTITVQGEFKNTGSGCSTLWFQWGDQTGAIIEKSASLCGPGSTPVNAEKSVPVQGSSYVYVCKGTEDMKDCGTRFMISAWS